MTDAFTFTPAERETLGQDGNDLLIVNNGDGSDFLETSLEAAGLEVVVAAATTEGEGGLGNDFVQVNGANAPDPAIGLAPLGDDGAHEDRGGYGQDALIDIGAGHWDDNLA